MVGASGHASVVVDILERQGSCRIVGLIDHRGSGSAMGYEILGTEAEFKRIANDFAIEGAIVAIGDNWTRHLVVRSLRASMPVLPFVSAIHPSAQIARCANLDQGCVVMAGAVVNPNAGVGAFCIVNTNASLDHDSVMEEFASLAPNASTGGNVRIGAFSAICQGANVTHGVAIGEHTVVGAGSTVLHSLPPFVVAYGTPARVVTNRQAGDKYL